MPGISFSPISGLPISGLPDATTAVTPFVEWSVGALQGKPPNRPYPETTFPGSSLGWAPTPWIDWVPTTRQGRPALARYPETTFPGTAINWAPTSFVPWANTWPPPRLRAAPIETVFLAASVPANEITTWQLWSNDSAARRHAPPFPIATFLNTALGGTLGSFLDWAPPVITSAIGAPHAPVVALPWTALGLTLSRFLDWSISPRSIAGARARFPETTFAGASLGWAPTAFVLWANDPGPPKLPPPFVTVTPHGQSIGWAPTPWLPWADALPARAWPTAAVALPFLAASPFGGPLAPWYGAVDTPAPALLSRAFVETPFLPPAIYPPAEFFVWANDPPPRRWPPQHSSASVPWSRAIFLPTCLEWMLADAADLRISLRDGPELALSLADGPALFWTLDFPCMGPYQVGDTVTVTATITDPFGHPYNPGQVTLTVQDPAGITTTPTLTHPSPGVFSARILATRAGAWLLEWVATGEIDGAMPGSFYVEQPPF